MGNRKRRQRKSVASRGGGTDESRGGGARDARGGDAPRRALRVIAIVYLFVAASCAVSIPLGKGPDETAHVRYIEFVARERGLPVFDRANPDPDYEFHQPPLYYAMAAPVYALAGGNESAQLALRFFTVLLSLPLIYLTFGLGRLLGPGEPWAAAAAAGIVAFLPMQLSVATTIGNDALTEVLAAGVLLALVSYLRGAEQGREEGEERPPGVGAMVAVGVMIGLAMLTKSIGVLLFPVAWVAAGLAARGREGYRWRLLARDVGVVTGVALALCGWWLVRNQMLYGDLLAQRAFLDAFEGLRPSPQSFMEKYEVPSVMSYVGQVMIWTMASVTGVFGPVHGNRFAFFPYYVYFATGLMAAAGAIGFARYWERANPAGWQRQGWGICGLVAVLLLGSFVRFNFSFFQAQARYMFPVLPAAALAFGLGVQALFPERLGRYMLVAVVVLVALLAFVGVHLWIAPQFPRA